MASIFDKDTREEIIKRIGSLNENSLPQWGKMTVGQMVRHCSLCEEYYYGNIKVHRSFLGRIFGQSAIKGILKDEITGLKKSAPTSPQFIVSEDIKDLETEKLKWESLISRYETFENKTFTHWFFGKMSRIQLGQFIYKHCDHHLKQFSA